MKYRPDSALHGKGAFFRRWLLLCALSASVLPVYTASATSSKELLSEPGDGIGFKARRSNAQRQGLMATGGIDLARFSFTAPGAARPTERVASNEREFQFTPAGGRDKRQVTLGVTSRTSAQQVASATQARAAATNATPIGPESYGFDLAVGWQGLAVSGGMTRTVTTAGREREGYGLGLSYGGRTWRTGLRASAERGSLLVPQSEALATERYAIEASGALSVAPSVSLGGTLRYQPAPIHPTPLDPNKDDRAVFLGGKVDF